MNLQTHASSHRTFTQALRSSPHRARRLLTMERCEERILMAFANFAISNAAPVLRPVSVPAIATFQVTLSTLSANSGVFSVDYTTVDGTATAAGGDYIPTKGVLTFQPFEVSKDIQVQVLPSTQNQSNKTFFVDLSNPSPQDATDITVAQGAATIVDSNPAGTVQFSTPTYWAGELGGNAVVTVARTLGRASDVSVDYATIKGGTAVPNVDYIPMSGTLRFGFNQTTQQFIIPILPNAYSITDRTIALSLFNPLGGASLGVPDNATLTIVNVNPLVVTNTSDSGIGSLRQAILTADSLPNGGTITFNIPGAGPQTIQPGTPLPPIIKPVTIDGRTQPGYSGSPVVEVNGSLLAQATSGGVTGGTADASSVAPDGLDIAAGGSVIAGLAIGGFPGSGIALRNAGQNKIVGNYLGTNATGDQADGNGESGISIENSAGNVIGGPAAGAGNLISGNCLLGLSIAGASAGANIIQGNRIGTDASGRTALGNAEDGILIKDSSGNTIGGPGSGNLISGNSFVGVQILGQSSGNILQGNKIGVDLSGTSALPNGQDGVFINGASNNIIGGTATGAGNLISGNGSVGVQILGPGASGNTLFGNVIGADAGGISALGNGLDGVFITHASGNQVGGSSPGMGNLISGNGSVGVQIHGPGASGNLIQGDKIGTDPSGRFSVANKRDGVFLNDASGNTIGGPAKGAGNLISGNGVVGLQIFGRGGSGNVVQGNTIGANVDGRPNLGNAQKPLVLE